MGVYKEKTWPKEQVKTDRGGGGEAKEELEKLVLESPSSALDLNKL